MLAVASVALVSCKKDQALTIDDATAKRAELAHADAGKLALIKFENPEHDFGTIQQGQKVEHTFKYTNAGTADLIITNAKASCGCTVPDYTKEPVAPGKTGEVHVVFDSTGKSGEVTKTVTITLNTEAGTEQVSFKANIENKGIGVVPAAH